MLNIQLLSGTINGVRSGIVSRITNPISLFVDTTTVSERTYPRQSCLQIYDAQLRILEKIAKQGIVVEISPTSNDILSRRIRKVEGWNFINPMLLAIEHSVTIYVTDDDPLIFGTNFLEELSRLYFGKTAYGRIEPYDIFNLIESSINLKRPRELEMAL